MFARQRVEVVEVGGRDAVAALARAADAGADGAEARPPADHEQVRVLVAEDLEVRDVDAGDLRRAQVGHALVVLAVVGDRAGAVLLLQAADPVREARACRGPPTAAPGGRRASRAGTAAPPAGFVRKFGSIAGRSAASGSFHGSLELAM